MADLYPQFILSGSIGLQASANQNLFNSSGTTSLASAGVVWNVLNYGRIKDNVRAQDAAYQELIANYQNTVVTAYSEVENAMVGYTQARKQVGFYDQSVKASDRSVEIAIDQYQGGTQDYSRVIDALSAALRADADLIQARASVSNNLVAIYKGLGGGWQIRQGREFLPSDVLAEMSYRTDWGELLSQDPEGASIR